jgi:hypothetical protein
MPTAPSTYRNLSRRGARLAAAVLPLPALLLAPAPAHAGAPLAIAICGGGDRVVTLPTREGPSPRRDDQPVCAHFACPRERGQGVPTDDDED